MTLNIRVSDAMRRVIAARAKGQWRSISEQVRMYLVVAMIMEEDNLSWSQAFHQVVEAR